MFLSSFSSTFFSNSFYRSSNQILILFVFFLGGGLSRPVLAAPYESAGSGHIILQSATGSPVDAVHLRSSVDVTINGLVSRVHLTQQFRNQTDTWQEATYLLPLPDDAAVTEMEMVVGDRRIRAEIKEKQQAREIYREAKAAGKKAALTEQSRANLFRQTVANIAPGETIHLTLTYTHLVQHERGEFSVRLPLTLTPRYMPGDPVPAIEEAPLEPGLRGWAHPTTEVADASLISPPMRHVPAGELVNPVAITVSLNPGLPLAEVASPYHDISVSRQAGFYDISLVAGEVSMDRDFLLRWKPEVGQTPAAAVFTEEFEGAAYTLVMMMPPEHGFHLRPLPRDMIFVVDTSGSMQGTSIVQARQSLIKALDSLRPEDSFNIIEFNSGWQRLFDAPQPVDPYYLQRARQWVSQLSADGGTRMLPALQAAMDEPVSPGSIQHIIFMTDGAVGNETALFQAINDHIGDGRLFPVGIGSAPNVHFMREAAKRGRGTHVHIGDLADISVQIEKLFNRINNPLVTDIEVAWPGFADAYPKRIPALYDGEPLVVVARSENLSGDVVVMGRTAQTPWQRSLSISHPSRESGIATLWGRKKIESLTWAEVMGEDVRQEIIDVGLLHHLVSKYTSLVAVEEWISRLPEDALAQSAVPNAMPRGHAARYPGTATPATLLLRLGIGFLLLAGCFLYLEVRRRVRFA